MVELNLECVRCCGVQLSRVPHYAREVGLRPCCAVHQVVEFGSHEELVRLEKAYCELVRLQGM